MPWMPLLGCTSHLGYRTLPTHGVSITLKRRCQTLLCNSLPWGSFCQLADTELAVGQNQWYRFGVGAPPILVYLSGKLGCSLGVRDFDPWLIHLWAQKFLPENSHEIASPFAKRAPVSIPRFLSIVRTGAAAENLQNDQGHSAEAMGVSSLGVPPPKNFPLLENRLYFPLLVLKGIYHYWKYLLVN